MLLPLMAAPAVAQQVQETAPQAQEEAAPPAAPAEIRCACSMDISFANPERHLYWQRSSIHADMAVALTAVEDRYRAGRLDEMAVCEDVRVPRKGEPFRTVDLCLHMDEWLQRVRDEGRCGIAPGAAAAGNGASGAPALAAARCRLPALDRGTADFVTATGRGANAAEALCDAFAGVAELRLIEEVQALEDDSLHGLPDIRHSHSCRPL